MNTFFTEYNEMYPYRDAYTTIAITTNGVQVLDHQITAFAYARVRGGKVVDKDSWLFDWTKKPTLGPEISVEQHMRDQEAVERKYLDNGVRFGVTRKKLQREGLLPCDALGQALIVIEEAEERDEPIVMHNAFQFEVPFLEHGINTWFTAPMGETFYFDDAMVYDAGMVEKASQLSDSWGSLPWACESPSKCLSEKAFSA